MIARLNSERGNSLIQVVIAAGLLSVLSLGVSSMIANVTKQTKAMSEKMLSTEIQQTLGSLFSNSNYCDCIFRGKTFNTDTKTWNAPPIIVAIPGSFTVVPAFPALCTASANNIVPPVTSTVGGSTMTVESIDVNGIEETTVGSGNYRANIEVGFNNSVRKFKNIKTSFGFSVNLASGTSTARPFSGCGTSASNSLANTDAGMLGYFYATTAPQGWVEARSDQTIGNASSGATRANSDTQSLYALVWAVTSNAIFGSLGMPTTRGASAALDFAAGKRLALPEMRAEWVRGLDNGRGVDTAVLRTLGSAQADQLKWHKHNFYASTTSSDSTAPDDERNTGYREASYDTSYAGGTENSGENRTRNVALLACWKL